MKNKINIPKNLQFKIYSSLIITIILFIFVYVSLYLIGGHISLWLNIPKYYNFFGTALVALGIIPLFYAVIKKSDDTDIELQQKNAPEIFNIIKEVSQEYHIKMPSKVLILPTEEIYVRGIFKKTIGIGIAGLRSISKDEFKSIIRHEFGHFYGKDTIVGLFLSKIQIFLSSSDSFGKSWWDRIPFLEVAIIGLAIRFFAIFYSLLFGIIISIYSKQSEYRADYLSSKFLDNDKLGSALLNYSAYVAYFGNVGYNSIIESLQKGTTYDNIYDSVFQDYVKESNEKLKTTVFEMDKKRIFTTHPTLKKRLNRIGINIDSIKIDKTSKPRAISMIINQDQIEKDFTELIIYNINRYLLYTEAVARGGKCKYCGKQFEKLDDLLIHEESCKKAKDNVPTDENVKTENFIDEVEELQEDKKIKSCSSCGFENKPDSKFCKKCGTKLGE